MNFSKSLFIIIFLLIGQNAIAQTKQIILRIDTLIQKDYNQDFFVKTQKGKILMPYLISDSSCKVDYRNNSLTCKVILQNDSSTIQISLDEKGGYLELSNVFSLDSDTIRISKFKVYDRPYPDTNWTTTNYWYEEADTLGQNFKNKRKYSIDKVKTKNLAPIQTQYEINGETYSCSTSWQKANYKSVTKFHGRGQTGLLKGKRPFYFHGTTLSTVTVNTIYIRLKNGL
jgi:hypothetical protein